MSKLRRFMHDRKLSLSILLFFISLVLVVLGFLGIPSNQENRGSGPLAFAGGWNIFIVLFSVIGAIIGGYFLYRYVHDKSRFEEFMRTDSQAIFKRNQIEIERLALRLTTKEEKRVIEAMRRYRIK